MLAILRNSPDSVSMSSTRNLVDPTMMDLYPHDCVHKVSWFLHFLLLCLWFWVFGFSPKKLEDCTAHSLTKKMLIFFFIVFLGLMERKNKNNNYNFDVTYQGMTFCIRFYSTDSLILVFWCVVSVHRWPCWQSNVWKRIPYYALTWSKLWFPSHKYCCLQLSGKLLLLGTARYSAVLFREDSLHTNIISAHYTIIFSSPFYNTNTIKYELRLDMKPTGQLYFIGQSFGS